MAGPTLDAEFREYDAGIFQRLNEFRVARDCLESSRESLADLGDLICLYGLHKRIGVSLLHKHFDISDSELVVREFDHNVSYIKPWEIGRPNSPVPYLWKAEIRGSRALYYPLEFCDYPEDLKGEALHELENLHGSATFLSAFASKLADLGLIDVFGFVSLRSRDGLTIELDETLLETTDEERKILTLRPAQISEIEGLATTQTLWMYRPASSRVGAVIAGTGCAVHCAAHCLAHDTGHESTYADVRQQ